MLRMPRPRAQSVSVESFAMPRLRASCREPRPVAQTHHILDVGPTGGCQFDVSSMHAYMRIYDRV